MLDWIENTFSTIVGLITGSWQTALNSVVDAVRQVFRTQYQYHSGIYSAVRNQWMRVAGASSDATFQTLRFMYFATVQFQRIRNIDIPYLENWLQWLGGTLRNYINDQVSELRRQETADKAALDGRISSLQAWVIEHVLLFLFKILTTVVSWIAGNGSTMWYYFSNLDKFGLLLVWHIVNALESLAWDVASRLGKFFLALIAHNVVQFATLVESIIDAVL